LQPWSCINSLHLDRLATHSSLLLFSSFYYTADFGLTSLQPITVPDAAEQATLPCQWWWKSAGAVLPFLQ
jgi:hypothetical protein